MDCELLFNRQIDKMNNNFANLHESANVGIYNSAKYEDYGMLRITISDFFANLSKTIGDFSKGTDVIVKKYIDAVESMMNNGPSREVLKNKNILASVKLDRPYTTTGYVYTMEVVRSIDLRLLNELTKVDRIFNQLQQYSSGELIDVEYKFLDGYDKPTVMGRSIGLSNAITEAQFKKLLFTAFRDGEYEPSILNVDSKGVKAILDDYIKYIPNDMSDIVSLWQTIYGICDTITKSITNSRLRIQAVMDKAPKNSETASACIRFLDSAKKSSIAIDDILNIYARLIKAACTAMISRISQDQTILLGVLSEVKK